MMRLLNMLVIAALVSAAAYVYKIKFDSTRQAERIAKVRMEIRQEQDAIASLRAEWSKLETPARIQELAKRHLTSCARSIRGSSTRCAICRNGRRIWCRRTPPTRSDRCSKIPT